MIDINLRVFFTKLGLLNLVERFSYEAASESLRYAAMAVNVFFFNPSLLKSPDRNDCRNLKVNELS